MALTRRFRRRRRRTGGGGGCTIEYAQALCWEVGSTYDVAGRARGRGPLYSPVRLPAVPLPVPRYPPLPPLSRAFACLIGSCCRGRARFFLLGTRFIAWVLDHRRGRCGRRWECCNACPASCSLFTGWERERSEEVLEEEDPQLLEIAQ